MKVCSGKRQAARRSMSLNVMNSMHALQLFDEME
jgi:hypothetical protein